MFASVVHASVGLAVAFKHFNAYGLWSLIKTSFLTCCGWRKGTCWIYVSKNPLIGSAEPIVPLYETTICDTLGFKTLLTGSAEPIVLLHGTSTSWICDSGTRFLVPRNRSLCYTEPALLEFVTQEPVHWFRGTDCFATQNVSFLNLFLRNPFAVFTEPIV